MRNYSDMIGEKNPNFRTGMAAKGSKYEKLYSSWQNMKGRCLRISHPKFPRYGGRDIKICREWLTADGFLKWAIASGWKEGMTIDRINNDGDYDPSNCRWISMSENSRKKRTTKITFDQAINIRSRALNGECEYDLAREFGVVHGTIWFIVNNFTHVEEGECTKKLNERNEKNNLVMEK